MDLRAYGLEADHAGQHLWQRHQQGDRAEQRQAAERQRQITVEAQPVGLGRVADHSIRMASIVSMIAGMSLP